MKQEESIDKQQKNKKKEIIKNDQLSYFSDLLQSKNLIELQKIGDQYFQAQRYINAIVFYQKIIQSGYNIDFQIQGLGNFDAATYNYEWQAYKWYNQQRIIGKFKGNPYDALSLCYCKIRDKNPQQLQKGIIWYQDQLATNKTYELYMGYANILYNKYKYSLALKIYKKVIELRPTLINAYVGIMFLHQFRRVQKPKAISMAKNILEKDPQNQFAHFILGKNIVNIQERIKTLQQSALKFPTYIRLVNEVGLSYGGKKDHVSAIKWYKKCLQLAPDHYAQGYNNVAFRTGLLEKYEQAVHYFYKAFELDSQYKLGYSNAIDVLNKLNYTDEMIIQKTQQYPKINKFNFCYYFGLAYYDKPVNKQIAIKWYKRALQLNQKSHNVYNSMGLAYDSLAKYTQSEECYLKSIQLNSKYRYPYYNMGLMFKHKGNTQLAIQWYKKAIQNDPEYHPPYNNLGNIYRDQGQYQKAIQCYKKAVEIHSTYTLVYCNMGLCYLKQQMYQKAFSSFERAKQLLPTDNNGLSQANKAFLKENIALFDKQGQKWRKQCSIGKQQKEQIVLEVIKKRRRSFKTLNFKDNKIVIRK